jgi:hypothetical protein
MKSDAIISTVGEIKSRKILTERKNPIPVKIIPAGGYT